MFTVLTLMQMASSGIPGVTDDAVRYVQRALLPDLSAAEAAAVFSRMIEESLSNWFTQVRTASRVGGDALGAPLRSLSLLPKYPFLSVELLHPQPRPDEVLRV